MRKIYTIFLLTFMAILNASAQYTTDGYYRVCNKGTDRYIYVTDNTGSYDIARQIGDFAALQLWKTTGRDYVSDPASIIFINKKTEQSFDLCAQNTGIYALVSRYVGVSLERTGQWKGTYTVYATEQGLTKYLSDNEHSSVDDGVMGTDGTAPYRNWTVTPVDASSSCYFGITPNTQIGDKYYYPFFAAFPFTCKSSGMKVYTITKVEEGMAVLKELTGTVPASTPVLIECSSANPSNNRLDLLFSNAAAPSDNLLRGVYFCNPKRPKSKDAITAFDASTMRVLGKTQDGKLGFVSSSENLYDYAGNKNLAAGIYLPANQAYLPVQAGTAAELTIVTEAEYNEILANKTYTLTYVVDGETYTTTQLKAGASITPASAPTKEGYTFSGWSEVPGTMPAHDVTVTGNFTINSYQLVYTVDGNTYQSATITYGAAITPADAPTKEGYTFSGWSEMPETMPAHDVTVTGSFTVNSYVLTYIVDGETYQTVEVAYGTPLTPVDAPTKEGYTFSGWSNVPETMPARDVTITGSFTAGAYTLTYVVDGEVYQTYSYDCDAAVTPVDAPTKEGYTFSGWSEVPETMPGHDITVTGSFAVNYYTVTYMAGDEVLYQESVAYGDVLPQYTIDPEHFPDYLTFLGWIGEDCDTMPAHDVIFVADFYNGINDIQAAERDARIYDLNGRLLQHAPGRGIYIRNGKKYINK